MKGLIPMTSFNLKDAVEKRKSVRTYIEKPLENADKEKVLAYINFLATEPHPFSAKVRIRLFDVDKDINAKDLGTYGVIKGARSYLGVAVNEAPDAMEAVGYVFEKLVLYAQSIGLGTCWLGGTFNRGEFAKAMELTDDEFFPIASPIGYPAPKNHTVDKIMRKAIKADTRKNFEEIFFNGNLNTPLEKNSAGEYLYALEMTRLAPSAKNAQPWRIIKDGNSFHFFEKKTIPSSSHDIQRLDIGIALCHLELALKEKGINGNTVEYESSPVGNNGLLYVLSHICK